MAQTPTYALPYPSNYTGTADVPIDMKALADAVEAALAQMKTQTDAAIAAAQRSASIPGEVKMWPGSTLPAQATYGTWVWADGTAYATATYPIASGNIHANWKTFGGLADPGAGMFRVPDLRGVTPSGMDSMPGGSRVNRVTRATAATLAGRTGEEYHTVSVAEMPSHGHGVSDPTHAHSISDPGHTHAIYLVNGNVAGGEWRATLSNHAADGWHGDIDTRGTGIGIYGAGTGVSVGNTGSGGAHETMQPTVFVPWIVRLDG